MRLVCVWLAVSCALWAENWPQWRGPGGSGVQNGEGAPPVEFGPGKHLLWKQPLPAGHSSPAVWGDRIFLTGFDKAAGKLEVLCLSRKDGSILWRRPVPAERIEKVHAVSSPANATPVVDGERVYAYFGSYGLMAFDHQGELKWRLPLAPPETMFGSGASPALAGELLIVNRDAIKDGYLLAVDRKTGQEVWRTAFPAAAGRRAESYSTPVLWNGLLLLHRAGCIDAYQLKDGRRRWWVNAATTGTSTVAADEKHVFAATWFPFGEADQMVPLPTFAELASKHDANRDGKVGIEEFPADLAAVRRPDAPAVAGATIYVKPYLKGLDLNQDGAIDEKEWNTILTAIPKMTQDHGLLAIGPSGDGDITAAVEWKEKNSIPEVPSPLVYQGRVYIVRNGGIVTCLDAGSGKRLYRARTGAGGPYYSSPVAANGNIYIASGEGTVVVIPAADELKVLARNALEEEIYATPAFAGDTLFVRTTAHLWAFGSK